MDTHQISDALSENIDDIKDTVSHGSGKVVAIVVATYLFVVACVAWYWSREPEPFAIRVLRTESAATVGLTTTQALQDITALMLNKHGGYLSNDILPPGVWMDDMPAWERGVLLQLRDFSKALKQRIGRSPESFREDHDLVVTESRFLFDMHSWMLPSSGSQYGEGLEHLRIYQSRLQSGGDDKAVFTANADNLVFWLAMVEQRLDVLSQRLGAADLPTLAADDVFYEARGTTWALIHLLKAVQVDFADTLQQKQASERLQQIIVELEGSQHAVRSPMILSGSGFGVLANHPLVMASYVSRCKTGLADLRLMLTTPTTTPAP